jgi:hypothetical protein
MACLTQWSIPSVGGRCLRGSTRSNLRSSTFCSPGALSYVMPLLVLHGYTNENEPTSTSR